MILSLGQASKEVGLSKTAISNAIKNGRLSATKKENGGYEIDPAELFRVYPPKQSSNGQEFTNVNPKKLGATGVNIDTLSEKVGGLTALLDEKEKQIIRLIREKEKTDELLDKQMDHAKKITLLLENKSSGGGEWEKSLKALENRISNQEKTAKETAEKEQKIIRQNRALKKALDEERNKSFFKKLFG